MKLWGWCLLGLLVLSGCGGTPEPARSPLDRPAGPEPDVPSPVETPSAEATLSSPTAVSSPRSEPAAPIGSPVPAVSPADVLLPAVAEAAGVPAAALQVISVEAMQWPDAGLGCPRPGMSYIQVITPGWQVVYRDSEGRLIEVHAPADLRNFVICSVGSEESLDTAPALEGTAEVHAAALEAVAALRGTDKAELQVERSESVEWPDSCMGCAPPGMACLMVITPGYRVWVRTGDGLVEVHTDETGKRATVCEMERPRGTPRRP